MNKNKLLATKYLQKFNFLFNCLKSYTQTFMYTRFAIENYIKSRPLNTYRHNHIQFNYVLNIFCSNQACFRI